MPHAIDIDGLVRLGTTTAGTGAVDDGFDAACAKPGGKRGDSSVAGNIAGLRAPGFDHGEACSGLRRVRETDDLMPGGMKEVCGTLADESTTCDEHLHNGRCF
jgi:hypothetical protein